MFQILNFLPALLWPALLVLGILGFFAGSLPPLKPYALFCKILGGMLVATTIFILGILHADHTWRAAAQELQAKVALAEAKSQETNTVIETKVVNKTRVVRERGAEVVKYVDREVVKHDSTCVIPPEFVAAHNTAAKAPK